MKDMGRRVQGVVIHNAQTAPPWGRGLSALGAVQRTVPVLGGVLLLLFGLPGVAFAASGGAQISAGDTAWLLASSALVLLMTPGLAFYYGGLVRRKNVVTTLFQVFAVIAVVSVQWVVFGYSLAFGPDVGHIVGNLSWAFLNNITSNGGGTYAGTVPALAFSIFQMMFAIITPALIVGGLAERVKFSSFIAFIVLWATFVYDPLAHWVWGHGGWLAGLGLLDFAGGTVVHVSSGVAGLVAAIYLGRRHAVGGKVVVRAHNVPMVLLGTALLWFGWFGFNAGSALSANSVAAVAFMTTNTATAASAISWMLMERWKAGRVTLVGASAGAVAGLVAITPAAGFVTPAASILIGLGSGVVCYLGSSVLKNRFGYDDALDAFGGHGVGGTFGALATGLFATVAVNSAGANGLFYGNPHQVLIQLLGVLAAWTLSGVGTYLILRFVDAVMGLRVKTEDEHIGLDLVLHSEAAYTEGEETA